ncbi:NADPH-dependent F420 reductase [Streptomyces sp. NPDC051569]|uniref:NADPH-dependent F420 reductase n=1 Tax=Streptomyces sp. NPDC051569 TaxID=3365661 RepID=UPI0037A131F7
MSAIGLIGSGSIGSTVARLGIAAGLDVVLSNSRGPETLADLVAELGPRARAATPSEAAAAGDWVVVTIPLKNYPQVPVAPLAGKIVLDTINYYPERDGQVPELDAEQVTTSELLQRHLPESKVVKVFNNIFFRHLAALARPAGAPDRSALPIAGDDPGANASVAHLLDLLGYDALDTGSLADSWRFQRDAPAYVLPYAKDPEGIGIFDDHTGKQAEAATLRAALAEAVRPGR